MKKENFKTNAARFFGIAKERFVGAEVTNTSVIIAYYLLLSIFPLLIAVGNLLSFLYIDVEVAIDYLTVVLPDPVLPVLVPIVRSLLENASGGLFSISALGAIWSSSRGIGFIQKGLNKAYGLPNAGSFITKKLVSLFTIFLILLLLVAFALVSGLGEALLEMLEPAVPWAGALLRSVAGLKWPVAVVFVFLLMLLLYRVTPDVKLRLKSVLPGALFATVGLLVLVQGFSIYIRFSARRFTSYGALGTFFVLMFWLNFSAIILLAGAVLNASIQEYRFGKAEEEIGRVDTVIERTKENVGERLKRWLDKRKAKNKK